MGHEVVAVTQSPSPAATVVRDAPPTTSLAPGFRFHPTDEELVRYYLRRKACGKPFRFQAVSEIDVYKSAPWELQGYSSLKTRDLEWYFFSPVDRKYGNGSRLNRATGRGYWKATGKDRPVHHRSQMIGMKKTLVFHSGRAPDGKRTNWVMHEYRLVDEELEKAGVAQVLLLNLQFYSLVHIFYLIVLLVETYLKENSFYLFGRGKDAFVLCRIFQKSGLGPPTGDRYAPFLEEEWDDDAALLIPGGVPEDEMTNVDEARIERNNFDQNGNSNKTRSQSETHIESQPFPFVCKREKPEDLEHLSLVDTKRPKHNDPNSGRANGSEDSSQDPSTTITTNLSSALMEFPLLDYIENKGNHSTSTITFDSANLEKSVPPGYLKFISNLEHEILNVSMERETLKIEVLRAQAMINVLQSRIDLLSKENVDLRKRLV